MPKLLLLPSQVNSVAQLIKEASLDVREFRWEETYTTVQQVGGGQDPVMVSRLVHTPTDFQFVFDFNERSYYHSFFTPGESRPYERNHTVVWEGQLDDVCRWLTFVKREYEAPNLWAQLQQGVGELPPPGGSKNTPFTGEERSQIEQQLREVLESVARTHQLTTDQVRALEEKVDYMVEATTRLGRLDWRAVFITVMAEEIFRLGLESDLFRNLVGLSLRGLSQLFGGPEILGLP